MRQIFTGLAGDLRYALRTARRSPGFTTALVAVLALGLGANTAIFSVVNAVLLRPLAYPRPGELVCLFERDVIGYSPHNPVSPANYFDWQKETRSYSVIGAKGFGSFNLSGPGARPEWVEGSAATYTMFDVLGLKPLLGRTIQSADDRPEAAPVAVIGERLWRGRFGGNPAVIGRTIHLDRAPYTVVGVMPAIDDFPEAATQVWVPLRRLRSPSMMMARGNHFLRVFGRLRPGVSVEQARTELDGIAKRIWRAAPDSFTGKGANVVAMRDWAVGEVRTPLLVLLAAVGCVLLIVCVNAGNLLLARASVRRREIAVRLALGAGPLRLARQLLTETVAFAVAGASAGMLLAWGAVRALESTDAGLPRATAIALDTRVLLFAFGLSLLTGIAIGLAPAIRPQAELAAAMKEGRGTSGQATWRRRFRQWLVAGELAISLMLLAGAGLLLRSFVQLRSVQPGFRTEGVLTLAMSLPTSGYSDGRATPFYDRLLERARVLPGVVSAGIVSNAPLMGHWSDNSFKIEGRPPLPPGQFYNAVNLYADPGYFGTIGIPVLSGRAFTRFDKTSDAAGVTVISDSMAKKFWPGEDPIGQHIRLSDDGPKYEVIGVVGDFRSKLETAPEPAMYFPLADAWDLRAVLVLRAGAERAPLAPAALEEIRRLDPDLAVWQVLWMDELLDKATAGRRFSLTLLGGFAALALLLAAVGLYGVISYAVAQRTGEIGVRMALGARPGDVLRLVIAEGMRPVAAGAVAGALLAALASRLLKSMLYETTAWDPATFAAVTALLVIVSAAACTLPALRAARTDPATALRSE